MAARVVPQMEQGYPEPYRFGDIPASGFFIRNVNNIELTNVEIAWSQPDARPVFYLDNVKGADFFRIKTPKAVAAGVRAERCSGFQRKPVEKRQGHSTGQG